MKKNNKFKILILIMLLLLTTGCTKTLTDKNNQAVKNEKTQQTLTENIICQPTDKISIKAYEKNELPYDRFGISVGKRIGNAVNRNKHKRKLRAIIDNYKKLYVNNRDYIIILRGSAKNIPYLELNEDFLKIMNNIRKEIQNEKK